MERGASRLLLPFRRVPAIDCRDLGGESPEGFRPHRFRHERWTLRPFEIAVFESHRRAWREFLATNLELAVIMEDDLLFKADFAEAVAKLAAHRPRFDLVKLNHSMRPRRMGPALDGLPGIVLRPVQENIADAGGYLLSRPAAERLLDQSRQYCSHLDDFLFSPDRGLRIVQLFPPICGQVIYRPESVAGIAGFNLSTRIQQPSPADKGPVPFRLFKECRRLSKRFRWTVRSLASGGRRVDMAEWLRDFRPLSAE